MKLIPVSNADQLKFGINFLLLGQKKIMGIDGVSNSYRQSLAAEGVEAVWIDFTNLSNSFGTVHGITQVLLR